MSSFEEFLNSFDYENNKGKQFEHFVKWFLKNDPEWGTQTDEVWLWDDYPGRWGPDNGVDLVFRHKNGEIWAVQAKCYNPKYSITKEDVNSFLSESNRKEIDKRLLIASTDKVGKNARQVCKAQEKPVTLYLYSDFDKAAINYPSNFSQLSKAKRKKPPTPKPHQDEAIEAVIDGFKTSERGQMIMACGTGKTFTTLWIKEALNAKTTLVLLPSLGLVSQTLWQWTFASNIPFEVLCVCSDDTVGKRKDEDIITKEDMPEADEKKIKLA
jgi:predicted helicase